ncbi:TPA: hypothetical protein L7T55_002874 [Klebsiella pneumoniae]|nr:hypothetical protein [Klebsiella pneumoniae]HBQ2572825.1 hypothetical protein [Klebsiella pneumoniae]HCQ9234908.1 hypothetical protein [Klebsiella pneumoniae]
MEKEIYEHFLGMLPADTPKRFAKHAAMAMAVAAIDKAVEMGEALGLPPEESKRRLLMSLRYGHEMPERGEIIH